MKIAVLGCGTVGGGVISMLRQAKQLSLGAVLVREGKQKASFHVTDICSITEDPETDTVVEVMGGIHPAYEYVHAALSAGKHVVTANKALVAEKGPELAALAREHRVGFLFTAACGGGVPFLHNLALSRSSDSILTVGGILNGTTNYILDAMQTRGADYAEALSDAQALGYAEADPTADVSGLDALRKIMLACGVAFDALPTEGLLYEGITRLTAQDVRDFSSKKLVCRLLARAGQTEDGIYAFVEPTLLSAGAPEASVRDNYNLARYEAEYAGDIVLIGQGAGRYPTASAVLRDLEALREGQREMFSAACKPIAAKNELCVHSYYFRLPEALSADLPVRKAVSLNGITRVITQPISVAQAHALASSLRAHDASVFFAGMED